MFCHKDFIVIGNDIFKIVNISNRNNFFSLFSVTKLKFKLCIADKIVSLVAL